MVGPVKTMLVSCYLLLVSLWLSSSGFLQALILEQGMALAISKKTKANLFCISSTNFIDGVEDFFWRRKHVTFPSEETSANPEALLFFPRLLVGRRSRHLPLSCPSPWAVSPTSLCQLPGWRGFSQLLSVICPLFLQPALDPTHLSECRGRLYVKANFITQVFSN